MNQGIPNLVVVLETTPFWDLVGERDPLDLLEISDGLFNPFTLKVLPRYGMRPLTGQCLTEFEHCVFK